MRNPTRSEVSQFGEALWLIKQYMGPAKIVDIGKKAARELDGLGDRVIYVRHPSQ